MVRFTYKIPSLWFVTGRIVLATLIKRRLSPMDPTPRRKGVAESQDRGGEGVESASRGPSRRLGPPRETIRTPATSSVVAFKATSFPSWSLVLKGFGVDKDFLKEVFDHKCLPPRASSVLIKRSKVP